jgi:hypothetical protein
VLIKGSKKLPIELSVRIAQRTEQSSRNAIGTRSRLSRNASKIEDLGLAPRAGFEPATRGLTGVERTFCPRSFVIAEYPSNPSLPRASDHIYGTASWLSCLKPALQLDLRFIRFYPVIAVNRDAKIDRNVTGPVSLEEREAASDASCFDSAADRDTLMVSSGLSVGCGRAKYPFKKDNFKDAVLRLIPYVTVRNVKRG